MFEALKDLDLDALPKAVKEAVSAAQQEAFDVAKSIAVMAASNASISERNAALATQIAELEAVNARLEHYVK